MQNQSEYETPVLSLIDITKNLTAVLEEELDCLKNHRPSELSKFQERKNTLSASYQKELNNIKINGGLASAGNGEIVRALKKESRNFQKVLEKHHRHLKAKKNLSEQMIQDISHEVTNQSTSNNKYGRNAKFENSSAASKTTSLAINKTI